MYFGNVIPMSHGGTGATNRNGAMNNVLPDPTTNVNQIMFSDGVTWKAVVPASAGCQPLDSDLTAIAALTTTTFGRSLLALVDAASIRTTAGLGTAATQDATVFDAFGAAAAAQAASQPLDTDLTAIATLTTTSFGRSLLTSADAPSLRSTAGVSSTVVSVNLGVVSLRSGHADIVTGLTLTPGQDIRVQQLGGPYAGKGTLRDEAEMDGVTASGYAVNTNTVRIYWNATGSVKGYFRFALFTY